MTAVLPVEQTREAQLASQSRGVAAAVIVASTLTGAVLGVGGLGGREWGTWTSLAAIVLSGLWIAYTDHTAHLILNVTTATLGGIVIVTAQFSAVMGWVSLADLFRAGCAGLAVAAGYLVLVVLRASSPGDLKLAAVLAIPLGVAGWPAVLAGILFPYLLSWPEAVVRWRHGEKKSRLAFGPYLVAGAAISLLWSVIG